MAYTWIKTDMENNKFLAGLFKQFLRTDQIYLFQGKAQEGNPLNTWERKDFDGLISVLGYVGDKPVGVLYNDFKLNGGSFGSECSRRMIAFLKSCEELKVPVVLMLNTLGVRMMEGRKVFAEAFQTIPALKQFAHNNLLITCTTGRCLGIGALLYALGDYRLALKDQTQLNLTGPEVFKLFFGDKLNFEEISSAERQMEKTGLIQEIQEGKEALYQRIKEILNSQYSQGLYKAIEIKEMDHYQAKLLTLLEDISGGLGQVTELFHQQKAAVHVYLVANEGQSFGLFVNPPGKANMIDVTTIEKYQAGMQLFRKMQLPIVSFVETSGGDPRVEQNDNNIIGKLTAMTADIIDYPYKKMGVVGDRCYGGASVLTFPHFFGGEKILTLDGARVGIMNNNIIRGLLSGTPRFLAEWEQNAQHETDDLKDMIDAGVISKMVPQHQLQKEILQVLFGDKALRPEAVQVQGQHPTKQASQQEQDLLASLMGLSTSTQAGLVDLVQY